MQDSWYIIVKAAETRDGYQDIEAGDPNRRVEYEPIAQFDHTYQQTGIREGVGDHPTYAEVAAGTSTQTNPANSTSEDPPSYSAIVKGGKTDPNGFC